MPLWLQIIFATAALIGTSLGAVNSYRAVKRSSPLEEVKKTFEAKWKSFYDEKWDALNAEVEKLRETVRDVDSARTREHFERLDAKLNNDNHRLKMLEDSDADLKLCLKLLLRSQRQMIEHQVTGNHVDKLKEVAHRIDDFLLEQL